MSRSLSTAAKRSAFAQETGLVWHTLITVKHPDLPNDERFVNNFENITSNGQTFKAFPFDLDLPREDESEPPSIELRIDNVDRTLSDIIESLSSPPTVDVEITTSNDPDTIEYGPVTFVWRETRYTAEVLIATLGFEPVLDEPVEKQRFVPADFPAVF